MSHYLLLGAGFSRNWGGWLAAEAFEYLLGRPEVIGNQVLRSVLWKGQARGGFEHALAELQVATRSGDGNAKQNLDALQAAVTAMFNDMNAGFYRLSTLNFRNTVDRSVTGFLANFDAIFTLNQDLLLEHHYLTNDPSLQSRGKWSGATMPGVKPTTPLGNGSDLSWANRSFVPLPEDQFGIQDRMQPLFKLHGSSNWHTDDGNSMLVMGGNKVREIGLSPILSWYQRQFEEFVSQPGARLMVIGYGFRDEHINEIIMRAIIHRGLKLFVIAPEGAGIARAANPTGGAAIYARTSLEDALESGLIGASRRGMREIFGDDEAELAKLRRFFD
jgi:hypothetical protein